MKLSIFILFFIYLLVVSIKSESIDAWKSFINKKDDSFSWTLNITYEFGNSKVYVLELISQEWMTTNSSVPIWKHWVQICVPISYVEPEDDSKKVSLLMVGGGTIDGWKTPLLTDLDSFSLGFCKNANQDDIITTILQIPNQPIIFNNDTSNPRSEDNLLSNSWLKAIETNDTNWNALLPMTNAVIKCMDAIQDFSASIGNFKVNKFVVTGHSKRGWVSWLTAMVDSRVQAIIPIAMPVLNIKSTILKHYEIYNGFSFAIQDYVNNNITSFLYTDHINFIIKMVDPTYFLESYQSIPKYMLIATGDEFFSVDATRSFFKILPGESSLSIIPNTNHNGIISTAETSIRVLNYYRNIKIATATSIRPKITWDIDYSNDNNSGTITMNIESASSVQSVLVWSGTTISTTKRDFRMLTCPSLECLQNIVWKSEILPLESSNTYTITKSKPDAGGWTGFYIQVVMIGDSNDLGNTSYTTEVAIVPNTLPFGQCPMSVCGSGKLPSDDNDDDSSSGSTSTSTSTSDSSTSTSTSTTSTSSSTSTSTNGGSTTTTTSTSTTAGGDDDEPNNSFKLIYSVSLIMISLIILIIM